MTDQIHCEPQKISIDWQLMFIGTTYIPSFFNGDYNVDFTIPVTESCVWPLTWFFLLINVICVIENNYCKLKKTYKS